MLSKTSPGFYVSAVKSFENIVGKEKLLFTTNFFFFHSIFYPLRELSTTFKKYEIVICKVYHLEESKICRLGKG